MKDMLSPTRPLTPEEEEVLQGIVDEVYDRFVRIIIDERNLDEHEVRNVADGRIFLAPEALQLGLIDSIGYRDDALVDLQKMLNLEQARLIRYEKVFSLRDLLGTAAWLPHPAVNSTIEALREMGTPRLSYLWTLGK
jgi:protease-4